MNYEYRNHVTAGRIICNQKRIIRKEKNYKIRFCSYLKTLKKKRVIEISQWMGICDEFYSNKEETIQNIVRRINYDGLKAINEIINAFEFVDFPQLKLKTPIHFLISYREYFPNDNYLNSLKEILFIRFYDLNDTNHFNLIENVMPFQDKNKYNNRTLSKTLWKEHYRIYRKHIASLDFDLFDGDYLDE